MVDLLICQTLGRRFPLAAAMGFPRGMFVSFLAAVLSLGAVAGALTAAEWRKQSIYQVVVDRLGRCDLSTATPCDTSKQVYCGGTWLGLISKLDYIQGMGFTAVWISPFTRQMEGDTADGYNTPLTHSPTHVTWAFPTLARGLGEKKAWGLVADTRLLV